jgi:hypothetical protein
MSHGQNLSSTSGEPEFMAQYFFEIPESSLSKMKKLVCASEISSRKTEEYSVLYWGWDRYFV